MRWGSKESRGEEKRVESGRKEEKLCWFAFPSPLRSSVAFFGGRERERPPPRLRPSFLLPSSSPLSSSSSSFRPPRGPVPERCAAAAAPEGGRPDKAVVRAAQSRARREGEGEGGGGRTPSIHSVPFHPLSLLLLPFSALQTDGPSVRPSVRPRGRETRRGSEASKAPPPSPYHSLAQWPFMEATPLQGEKRTGRVYVFPPKLSSSSSSSIFSSILVFLPSSE